MKKYLAQFSIVIASSLIVVGIVSAATTISTNISTGGQLTVTGTSTLMGNVGVGTAAPASNVEVQSQTTGASIRIASNADSVTSGAQTITFGTYIGGTFNTTGTLGDTSGVDSDIKIFATQGNLDLGANTGGAATKRLVIGSSGGVTVGNTDLATTTSKFYVNSTSPVVVDTSGNVGIGTTSPTANLQVKPASDSTSVFSVLNNAGKGLLNVDTTNGIVKVGSAYPNSSSLVINGINSNGVYPAANALTIYDNYTGVPIFQVLSTDGSNGKLILGAASGGASISSNSANIVVSNLASSGYVSTGGGTPNVYGMVGGASNKFLYLYANSNNILSLDGNYRGITVGSGYIGTSSPANGMIVQGNVGIGTTTPVANLQVTAAVNSTTTLEIGRGGSTKGSCVKLYDATGVAWYYTPSVSTGALIATSATSCASVAGF